MTKRILILKTDTGTGHRRTAEALEAIFQEAYQDVCKVFLANPIHRPSTPEVAQYIEDSYDDTITSGSALYKLAYDVTDNPVAAQMIQEVSAAVLDESLERLIATYQPDVMITTHPALTQAAIVAASATEQHIPVDVIVTDLVDVHSLWFHNEAAITFVPTDHVYRQALEHGLVEESVHLSGLPVHPAFAREVHDQAQIREALGWHPDLATALVVGSPRSTHMAAIVLLLDRSGLPLQIAAVAGGNEKDESELSSTEWQGPVYVYGFVQNIAEMMHAADFVVCKAGGLIVTEALACGLPIILYEALPGQEEGNVRYVVESGAGAWSPGSTEVLTTSYAWLVGDQTELQNRRAAAVHAGQPNAARTVADQIMKQVSQR
ncbi:MAG: glycosyltransferase [Anaerolineae bacterium]|nr:glycosyltransferase [Anaerolineae bacterium]